MERYHTGGPWACSVYSDAETRSNHRADIRGADGKRVAFAYADMTKMHRIESSANARLIAASPCLLTACEVGLQELQTLAHSFGLENFDGNPVVKQLKAAIAKATGGAQ